MPDQPGTPDASLTSFACCGMTRTHALEDTLKVILEMTGLAETVTTSGLAGRLHVTPPTSSAMVKRLVEHGLAEHRAPEGLVLTHHGASHARQIVRRHRLVETFLVEVLKFPWDEVYTEAESLEHAVSDASLARIDALLGHPTVDPHGDPIPRDADAEDAEAHVESWGLRLSDAAAGARFRVERLNNHNAPALRYLGRLGLRPGTTVEVLVRAPFGGPVWVVVDGRAHALGESLTRLVHGTALVGTDSR